MTVLKTLWASVQGDPAFMRRLNGWLTIFWLAMIPVSIMLGLLSSVVYVSALSLWALVSGHWSAWQAARVEVAQNEATQMLVENPIEERVVERLIEETDLEPAPGNTASVRQRVDELARNLAELQQHLDSGGGGDRVLDRRS